MGGARREVIDETVTTLKLDVSGGHEAYVTVLLGQGAF